MSRITVLDVLTAVNDANQVASALTGLAQTALAAGQSDVSAEDVAKARASLDSNIAKLDEMIAEARAGS
jgi:hypothetical protein